MQNIQANNGENLYYKDENPSGQPVILLLHGLGVNSKSWLFQVPAFTGAGYRTIAPDLPGFGQSCTIPFRNIQQATFQVTSLLQSIDVRSVIALGISMGGLLALQLALDQPHLVERLVLVNSMAKFHAENPLLWPYYVWRFLLIQVKGLEHQAEYVAKRLFPLPKDHLFRQGAIESIMEADLQSYHAAMKSIARFNVENRLSEIRCPTLVISGENDTTILPEYQRRMAGRIPQAVHVVVKDAGHAVTIDQPEVFNSSVLDFIADLPVLANPSSQVNK